jgi:hypothetical protein
MLQNPATAVQRSPIILLSGRGHNRAALNIELFIFAAQNFRGSEAIVSRKDVHPKRPTTI